MRIRTLAVRAYNTDAMMTGFELIEGLELEAAIQRLFDNPQATYLTYIMQRPDATPHESNGSKPCQHDLN